jgi:hypothetical protein
MFDMEKKEIKDIHYPNAARCYNIKYAICKVLISCPK